MANDVINDNFVADNDTPDPLADVDASDVDTEQDLTPQGDEPVGDQLDQSPEGDQDQPAAEAATRPGKPIQGTPFKDQAALVDGYKNLQRLVAAKDRDIVNLNKQVETIVAALTGKGKQPAKVVVPQGQEFWNAFAKDPNAVLQQLVQAQLDQILETRVDGRIGKIETSISAGEKREKVNDFMRTHTDLTQEDEDAMVEILDANPHLKDLPDGLELALDRVVASRYRASTKKSQTAAAVAGAKGVAGLGGKKTSLPSTSSSKDPFDEVLDLDKADRELYKLGKK